MKKVVSLVTIFVLCLTALAGCSGSKEVDLKTVLSDINSKYSLDLKELTDSNDLKKYYSKVKIIDPDRKSAGKFSEVLYFICKL